MVRRIRRSAWFKALVPELRKVMAAAAGEQNTITGPFSGEVARKEPKPAPTITEMAQRLKQFRAGGAK